MQQTTGVATLAAHLTGTDRRALSQAWYSALHLAAAAPRERGATAARTAPAAACGAPRAARDANEPAQRAGARGAPSAARTIPPRPEASACVPEGRFRKTAFARRLEQTPARRPARAASLALRAADGRIHLVVRGEGARTRVVAACAPPLRERVERALAHARCALARGGLRAEVA